MFLLAKCILPLRVPRERAGERVHFSPASKCALSLTLSLSTERGNQRGHDFFAFTISTGSGGGAGAGCGAPLPLAVCATSVGLNWLVTLLSSCASSSWPLGGMVCSNPSIAVP